MASGKLSSVEIKLKLLLQNLSSPPSSSLSSAADDQLKKRSSRSPSSILVPLVKDLLNSVMIARTLLHRSEFPMHYKSFSLPLPSTSSAAGDEKVPKSEKYPSSSHFSFVEPLQHPVVRENSFLRPEEADHRLRLVFQVQEIIDETDGIIDACFASNAFLAQSQLVEQAVENKKMVEGGNFFWDDLGHMITRIRKTLDGVTLKLFSTLENPDADCSTAIMRSYFGAKFEQTIEPPETTSKVGDAVIYGRVDDKKKVIELLLSGDCRELDISLIQITGAGGIGKSTLVYLVYNDSVICGYFDIKAWVHMPESIDLCGILKAIIESLTGISCGVTELNELQQIIGEELSEKRFLLVLDNVRNGTQSFWNSFMVSLSIGAKGSIVMVTTRKEILSDLMRSVRPYQLNRLSEEHCFSIFLEYAFDKQDPCIFQELIGIGKHIVTKCKGVPLAAKAIGGLLHFNENNFPTDSQNWKDVLESDLWDSDECLPALSLSYDYLPMHMKFCFRYCSLFPKGYMFEKDHLVKLWMSQGFLESKDGQAAEDIGIHCFEELLRRSFFQCLHIYDAKERKYGMHDLFHDFAQRVAMKECFRIEDSKLPCIPGDVSHISLVTCAVEALEFSNLFKEPRNLCTFLFIPGSASKWQGSAVHFENIIVLDDLFIKFRFLRSLDLSNTDFKELPDSIESLKSLCYLNLNNTNIRRLPDSICSLVSLQTLELQNCSFLSDLPANIKELTNLRCLNVFKESGFISMPSGIGELRNLRTLSNFNVGKVGWQCGIGELHNLLNLSGSLCIAGLENVVSGAQANQANLKIKGYLRTLTLHWFQSGWESDAETEQKAVDVIQYLQPHINLEELIIQGYFGSQFPTWLGDPLFCNLVSVTLDNCYESNVLPPLGQLPSLRFLSLQKMESVRTLGLFFCGSSTEVLSAFPSLEILKLWEMSELEEWNLVRDGDFPRLRSLSISMCLKLIQLPPLNYLRELIFHCCDKLPEIPQLKSLEYLKIDGFQKLEFLSLPHDLPALKKLEINNCGRLSLVVGLSELASVEQFKISKCPHIYISPDEQWLVDHQAVSVSGGCLLPSECSVNEVPASNEVLTQVIPEISHLHEQIYHQTGISSCLSSASLTQSLSGINMVTPKQLQPMNLGTSSHNFEASIASHCEKKSQSAAIVGRSVDDGDNWRMYGVKELKCGEHSQIYFYKCRHPKCPVRKKEHSFDGVVSKIIYKGQHSHQHPPPSTQSEECSNMPCGSVESNFQTTSKSLPLVDHSKFIKFSDTMDGKFKRNREFESGVSEKLSGFSDGKDGVVTEARAIEIEDNGEPEKKGRNLQTRVSKLASHSAVTESSIILPTSELKLYDDGYTWQKYGQRIILGPRSTYYYKCCIRGCPARKKVQSASNDPNAVEVIYTGNHNHGVPSANSTQKA